MVAMLIFEGEVAYNSLAQELCFLHAPLFLCCSMLLVMLLLSLLLRCLERCNKMSWLAVDWFSWSAPGRSNCAVGLSLPLVSLHACRDWLRLQHPQQQQQQQQQQRGAESGRGEDGGQEQQQGVGGGVVRGGVAVPLPILTPAQSEASSGHSTSTMLRVHSAQLGSARVGTGQLSSTQLRSGWLNCAAQLSTSQLSSGRQGWTGLGSACNAGMFVPSLSSLVCC